MHSSIYAQRLAGIHMLAKHANEKIVDWILQYYPKTVVRLQSLDGRIRTKRTQQACTWLNDSARASPDLAIVQFSIGCIHIERCSEQTCKH
jgi:hypothetical protein